MTEPTRRVSAGPVGSAARTSDLPVGKVAGVWIDVELQRRLQDQEVGIGGRPGTQPAQWHAECLPILRRGVHAIAQRRLVPQGAEALAQGTALTEIPLMEAIGRRSVESAWGRSRRR